jgi:hypothetical protein
VTPESLPDHDDPEYDDPAYEAWVADHASPDYEG